MRVEEELHPNLTPAMWLKVHVYVVHMPMGVGRRKYLFVARKNVSGWPEARPIRRANAATVADFLCEDVFTRHGCPTSFNKERRDRTGEERGVFNLPQESGPQQTGQDAG